MVRVYSLPCHPFWRHALIAAALPCVCAGYFKPTAAATWNGSLAGTPGSTGEEQRRAHVQQHQQQQGQGHQQQHEAASASGTEAGPKAAGFPAAGPGALPLSLAYYPPDVGPSLASPAWGVATVGAVPWVVNYNVPIEGLDLADGGFGGTVGDCAAS